MRAATRRRSNLAKGGAVQGPAQTLPQMTVLDCLCPLSHTYDCWCATGLRGAFHKKPGRRFRSAACCAVCRGTLGIAM